MPPTSIAAATVLATIAVAYVALIGLVIIARVLLKVFHWARSALRRIEVAEPQPSSPSQIIVLVHGTWARHAPWTLPKSRLRASLSRVFGANVLFERHPWSGANRFGARSRAAAALKERIRLLRTRHPTVPIAIVAHSHGGNIALSAVSQLLEGSVRAVVCLSTPFLIAEPRGLQEIGRFASWSVPSVICFVVLQLAFHTPGTQLTYVTHPVVIVIAALAGVAARSRARATAEALHHALSYKVPTATDVLLLRMPGDEASSGLNAVSLLSTALEGLTERITQPILDAESFLHGAKSRIRAHLSTVLCVSLVFVGVGTWLWTRAGSSGVAMRFALILYAGPVLLFVIATQGGFIFSIWKYSSAALALAPAGVLLAAFAIPLGPELALSALFLHVSAEPSPMGTFTVTMVPSAGRDSRGASRGVDSAPRVSGLKHSRTYDDARALDALATWLAARLAPPTSVPSDW